MAGYDSGYVDGASAVIAMLNQDCGDPDCGCDPILTDCCLPPRWTCQTTLIYDTAGDPDVRLCDPGHGCQEGQ